MRFALKVLSAGLLTAVLTGCSDSVGTTPAPTSGNGSTGTTTNVSVAVTPATTVIDARQTVALAATVSGDSTNEGVTWTVTTGGGTLASTTGLTNTYTAPSAAVATATVTATSVFDATKSASTTITVNALPNFTSTGQLAQGFVGIAYSATLAATGGTGTRTYALAAGSTLPAGLSLNATTGVISGVPTGSGSSTFAVSVTDSATKPVTATANFTLGVSMLQLVAPALPAVVAGNVYPTATYTAAFAQGAVTYAVTAGALPAGLTLSSGGVLSGTPNSAGTASFTVTATDSIGQKASSAGSITVVSQLALASATLPTTQANGTFADFPLTATGGTAPYTYKVAAGSILPAGLSLTGPGVITGTPTTPGSYSFGITATDSGAAGTTAQTVTAQYTLTVTIAPLTVTPASLPNAVVGSPYSETFTAVGGVSPYTFRISSGSLPAGLILSQAGILTGRVTGIGSASFTVEIDDAESTPMQVFLPITLVSSDTLPPGPNNAALKGGYAFVFTGQSNGALAANSTSSGSVYGADMAGSLTFDGVSAITGTIDLNSAVAGVQTAVPITGSYAVGTDNRGKIVLRYGASKVITLQMALSNFTGAVGGRFRFIEADSDNIINASQIQGSGEAVLQTPSSFTTASLLGRYVYRMSGETPSPAALSALNSSQPGASSQFGAISAAGYVSLGGPTGLIARGSVDAVTYNSAYSQISLSGSFTAPDASGRGTMTINSVGNSYPAAPTQYVYYVISGKQLALMSLDAHSGSSLMAGMAYQQQQTLYNSSSLTGTVIGSESALQGGNGTTTFPNILSATFYVLQVKSQGVMSAYSADNTNGISETFVSSPDVVNYSVSDIGRVTLYDTDAPTAQLPVFWLYDTNQGVGTELETGAGPVGALELDGQTAANFTAASVSGQYATGTAPTVGPVAFSTGLLDATPGVPATLTQDISSNGVLTTDQVTNLQKGVDGVGRFTVNGTNIFYNGYVLSATKLVYFNAYPGFTRPVIRIAEK